MFRFMDLVDHVCFFVPTYVLINIVIIACVEHRVVMNLSVNASV